jgi:transposase
MIGLDIAKSVFQVHGEDSAKQIVMQRRLRRSQVMAFFGRLPPARIGIEACGSAHHWARVPSALGDQVRPIPTGRIHDRSRPQVPSRQCPCATGAVHT